MVIRRRIITADGALNPSHSPGGRRAASGGTSGGGGGGCGRILIDTDNFTTLGNFDIDVAGGAGTNGSGGLSGSAGGFGTFDVADYVAPVPEPASIAIVEFIAGGLILRRRRELE